MGKLKEGLERSLLVLPDSGVDREMEAVNRQIFQDELRLAKERLGIKTEANEAYCPVARRTRERDYCKNMDGSGRVCASFEKCYY